MQLNSSQNGYMSLFTGINNEIPLLNGDQRKYINFDNAASTPPFKAVKNTVIQFMDFYSSVHRGTGYKSQLSTHAYELSRQAVLRFVSADPNIHTCIFGKNTTEAINKLARRYPFTDQRNLVITSGMEHHSNDLPWRAVADVIHVQLTEDGRLDVNNFDELLKQYSNRVALVAITGASNVTGFINPYYQLAEKTHSVGAKIVVDCAQLAPHRKVDMLPADDPAHLDFIAISAHKLYAPFGTGALVGPQELFASGAPDLTGGGTVEIVTLDDVIWASPPDRDEAGSPNTIGAIALASAVYQLEQVGMQAVADHEAQLTSFALEQLALFPEISVLGDTNPENSAERLGVIPFNLQGISHFLVAAILGHEYGIGVRSGCFCAHPYVLHLLKLNKEDEIKVRNQMIGGDRSQMPGMVRASFGLYNSVEEIEVLIEALKEILHGGYQGNYLQDRASGEFVPQGWTPDFDRYFSLQNLIELPNQNN